MRKNNHRSRMMQPAAPNAREKQGTATLERTEDLEAASALASKTLACRGTFFQRKRCALILVCVNEQISAFVRYYYLQFKNT
jgi:hypothetical protein